MLGLGNNLSKGGLATPGIVTSSLVLKHKYDASAVVPVSDGACTFNGTSDYIAIGAKPVDTADATYCFWAKSTETGANSCVFAHEATNQGAFHFNVGGTKPLLQLDGSVYKYFDDTPAQDEGKWHHWAVYVDSTNIIFYCQSNFFFCFTDT